MSKASKRSAAPNGLPAEFVTPLSKHLDLLKDAGAKIAADATHYVVGGEPSDLPLQLGGVTEAGKNLALAGLQSGLDWSLQRHLNEKRCELFAAGRDVPPAVWQRFGEVLAAAGRAGGRKVTPPNGWPEWLIILLGELVNSYNQGGNRDTPVWPAPLLAAVAAEAGRPTTDAIRVGFDTDFQAPLRSLGVWTYGTNERVFDGWPAFLAAHLADVREVLTALPAARCVPAIDALGRVKFDFGPVLDLVADLATGPSKTVRDALLPTLLRAAADAVPHVERHLAGDAGRRNEAAAVLWRLDPAKAADRLRAHLETESSERVRQTIGKMLAAPADAGPTDAGFDLPPVEVPVGVVPFPEAARGQVRAFFDKAHAQAVRSYEQELAQWNGPSRPTWMREPVRPTPLTERELSQLFDYVEGTVRTFDDRAAYQKPSVWSLTLGDDGFAPPRVQLVHVVRLERALNRLDAHGDAMSYHQTQNLEAYRGRCPEPFGLRELDAAVADLPVGKPGMVARAYLENNTRWGRTFCDWEPAAVWPGFVDHLPLLRDTLTGANRTGRDYNEPERRRNAFRVLAMFPHLPPGFVELLWDIAVGESKSERPLAQAALRTVPGKAEKILVALSDGRQAVRAAAAEWLGAIGDTAAVDPLIAAFRKEKQESVKGVVMTALDKLGADVDQFLDRKGLQKEAEAGLAKKALPAMAWFPLDHLPAVRWADSGKPVPPAVVKWWVVQSVQQKSPACGPILRRYLDLCRPADAAGLARFVLSAWIAHDTRTPPADEAMAKAKKDAASQWQSYGSHSWFIETYKDEEGLRAKLFQQYANSMVGSAAGEKGMLAVVSAAGDVACVRVCEAYIRTWFGQRLAQCKALVDVLAAVRQPMALQVLLSIAGRFRTKAVRELAGQHVKSIAEREGWTIDELADRTIPDAGFARPEGGGPATLVLDYGPRQFTATLTDDLEAVVRGENGKPLKSLPAPGKSDDAEKAKEARKAFTDAKKQVKEIVKRQTERLYEALCTQRAWRFADWQRFLLDHPVVGRLCVRLAWTADGADGERLTVFRPLEDGSLTTETDDPVTVPADAAVKLAHTATVGATAAAAWRQHFTDYDVSPPFDPFGRDAYVLPDAKKKETELKDFEGHRLTTFQVRGKATKLGYVRGDAEDGGWFRVYRKPFPSLALQAEIEFTGNGLPEEDRAAALESLSFARVRTDGEVADRWHGSKVELGKVPPVLLSECYNDMKQIAAEGTGYDPEWQNKSYY